MKKIGHIAIIVFFAALLCSSAFAADGEFVTADLGNSVFRAGSFSGPQSIEGKLTLDEESAAYTAILEGLRNKLTQINLSSYNIHNDDFWNLYATVFSVK